MGLPNVLGDNERLDEHDPTCSNDGQESDDIHSADGIEYDKAWASQRSVEEQHSFNVICQRSKR